MAGLRLRCFIPPTTTELSAVRCNPSVISFEWRNSEVRQPRNCRTAAARLGGERPDPLLEAAVRAAFLRFQESLRPDPQFIDPYSSCLLSSTVSHHDVESKYSPSPRQYRLATKFIDDNLLSMLGTTEDLRQIVLLTDGMDTRPYRLNWPRSSVIFDISPQSVFNIASQKLKEAGAKVSRNCISLHVPLESTDLQLALCERGYNGNKPSLWAIQGLPMSTMTNLIDILSLVSSSAMKGSIFLGELPTSLAVESSQIEAKDNRRDRIQRLLVNHGFRVNATSSDYESDDGSLLFLAEQLQFSDAQMYKITFKLTSLRCYLALQLSKSSRAFYNLHPPTYLRTQMEIWRTHLERIEDEGDEEGFDEL